MINEIMALVVKLLRQTLMAVKTAVSKNNPRYEPAAAPASIPLAVARLLIVK